MESKGLWFRADETLATNLFSIVTKNYVNLLMVKFRNLNITELICNNFEAFCAFLIIAIVLSTSF